MISKSENIKVDSTALELIAELGQGSLRDAISLLDQLAGGGKNVTLELVEQLVGRAPRKLVEDIMVAINSQKPRVVVELLTSAYASGIRPEAIASQLAASYRDNLLDNPNSADLDLMKHLISISASHSPDKLLEIILLEVSFSSSELQPTKVTAAGSSVKPESSRNYSRTTSSAKEPTDASMSAGSASLWQSVLDTLRGEHNTLYGMSRIAHATLDGDELVLEFAFPFQIKRINETRNKTIISDIITNLTGRKLTISCRLNPGIAKEAPAAALPILKTADSDIKYVNDIFGGAELLE